MTDQVVAEVDIPSYEHSRQLDVWRRSEQPYALKNAKQVLDMLIDSAIPLSNGDGAPLVETPNRNNKSFKPFKNHLTRVLWDLIVSRFDNQGYELAEDMIPWLGIQLNNNAAVPNSSRYNAIGWKPDQLRKVVRLLNLHGLIFVAPGYKDRVTGVGFSTRIRATPKLISLVTGIDPSMIDRDPLEESVRLKDDGKNGKLLEYVDNEQTEGFRKVVDMLNRKLSVIDLSLQLSREEREDLNTRCCLNYSRLHFHRQFKDDFHTGGRFYGPWFQNIPSEYRKALTINGERTVEIDYSALHPVMLYATEGLPIDGDPYLLPGYEAERSKLKLIFQFMINGKSKAGAKQTARSHPDVGPAYAHLVDVFEKHHEKILHHCYRDGFTGRLLQYRDSLIAEKIMVELWERDIPVLPVHDSFIVAEGYEGFLWSSMEQVLHEFLPELYATDYPLFKVTRADGSAEYLSSRMGVDRYAPF